MKTKTSSKIDLLTIKSGDLIHLHYTVFFNQTVEEAALSLGAVEEDMVIQFIGWPKDSNLGKTCEHFSDIIKNQPEIKNILVKKLDGWYYTYTSGILKKINSVNFDIIEKL